jgi:hypothetical protein
VLLFFPVPRTAAFFTSLDVGLEVLFFLFFLAMVVLLWLISNFRFQINPETETGSINHLQWFGTRVSEQTST